MQTEPNRCPKCQEPLPANAPQGLCPKCLLASAAVPTEPGQSTDKPSAPPLTTIAAAFPQLEIIEIIGQGGMGVVYKARQPKLDRLVALKVLPQALAADLTFAERFNREARVLARLNHPNIVTVYDFGQADGFFYLLMEYVDGVNLRQAMQAGRFAPEHAMTLVPRICEALQFAHDEGVLHRDIKPENILLDTRGRVKIADFGIAKLVGEAKFNLTASGMAVGTPHYMAPEQLERPQEVDQRADIYSLGVVFYEMLTGELPLGRFAPPSMKSAVDTRVDDIVFHALEKEKEKRFKSAGEVKTSVEAVTSAGPNPTPPHREAPEAPPSGAGAFHRERRAHCYISTPEHVRSFVGRCIWIYTGQGELVLDTENLTYLGDWNTVVIPLRQIKEMRRGNYSRLAKPLRLDYMAITYEDRGAEKNLLFTMAKGPISLPSAANLTTFEWFRAIREAVIAKTGKPPAGSSEDELRPTVGVGGLLIGLLVPLVLAAALAWLTAAGCRSFRNLHTSAPPSQAVIDTTVYPPNNPSDKTWQRWQFKCLIPPQTIARFVFIRWSNGQPVVIPVMSSYFKVGALPADVNLSISCNSRSPSDEVDWYSDWRPGLVNSSTFTNQPDYQKVEFPSRIVVKPGHQHAIPLVDYLTPNPHPGLEVWVLLDHLDSPPVRTVPSETSYGAYICGDYLDQTLEETLQMIKQRPLDQ